MLYALQEVWSRGEDLAALTKAKEDLQQDCQKVTKSHIYNG